MSETLHLNPEFIAGEVHTRDIQNNDVLLILEYCSSSTSVTPLTQCKKDIKKFLNFSGVEKEVELILAGCGCLLEMTICPAHRARTSNFLHHPGSCFGSLQGTEESNRTGKRNKFIPIQKDIRTFKTAHPCGLR